MVAAVPVPVVAAVRLPDAVLVAVSVPLPVDAAVPAAVREGEPVREAVLEAV